MTHWLHPDAEKELGAAAEYYLHHAGSAVAEAFLTEYERTRDLIVRNQRLATVDASGLRCFPFGRFPFSLVYEENIHLGPQIFAIVHQKREPDYWQGRIQEPPGLHPWY